MLHRLARFAIVAAGAWSHQVAAQGGGATVSVHGVAYDSLHGAPLKDALVVLLGVNQSATTDARGRFRFDSVPTGTRLVVLQHPVLDSIGLSGISRRFAIDGRAEITLAVPSYGALWQTACGGVSPNDSGFVFGTVRYALDRTPVVDAVVGLTWTHTKYSRKDGIVQTSRGRTTRTDARGSYVLCGVPATHWLRLSAIGAGAGGGIELPPGELRVQRRDLLIGPLADSDTTHRGTISGMLIDEEGSPYSEARIVMDDSIEMRSGGDGRFLFRGVPAGTRQIEVMSIGMMPIVMAVDVLPLDTAAVALRLRKVTTLDVVNVTATNRGRMLAQGIEERRKMGFGYTMDMTQLAAYHSFSTVLNDFPGVRIDQRSGDFHVYVADGRGGQCAVEVWVDGARMSQGALNMIRPKDVLAVELFPRLGTVPPQFRRTENQQQCGAVLVWTTWAFSR